MAIFPRKPVAGEKVLQSMYNAICQIIDFLPSLEVRGDNKTIKINSFAGGKTISAVATPAASPGGTAQEDNSPKLAKIISAQDASIGMYTVQLVTPTGDPLLDADGDEIQGRCIIPGLAPGSAVPTGTYVMVTPQYISAEMLDTNEGEE